MNLDVIKRFCGGETPEFYYMAEVAERIEKELSGGLSLDEAVSLFGLLAYNSFICSDGFMINDYSDKELYKTLGNRGAAAIASSLYNNGEVADDWFYWNYGSYLDSHEVKSILPKLLASGNLKEKK